MSEKIEKIYVLKVALAEKPDLWRRIAICGRHTLEDLHETIFDAFDRDDPHLYSFYIPRPGQSYRRLGNGVEYTTAVPDDGLAEFFGEADVSLAHETTLDSLGLKPRRKFSYLFDFGDQWWHELVVEKITDADSFEAAKLPCVLEKHGKSPPQYPRYALP